MYYEYKVDTALCIGEGRWPKVNKKDISVEVVGPYGEVYVLVSRRYTAPSRRDAAEIAVAAYDECQGSEVPWPGMGPRFYHVTTWRGTPDGCGRRGLVTQTADGGWTYQRTRD